MQVLIANENSSILNQLRNLLEELDIVNIQSANEPNELERLLVDQVFDFAVLGASLQETQVLDTLKKFHVEFPFILTSPVSEHAYQAIKAGVSDYLLEPLQHEDTMKALKAIMEQVRKKSIKNPLEGPNHKKRFLIKIGDKLKSINITEAAYIYAEGKVVYLITSTGNRKYIIDQTMDDLEKHLLNGDDFFRINRKYIVHIQAIEEARNYVNSRLKLVLNVPSDQDMVVSREKVAEFKRWLNL